MKETAEEWSIRTWKARHDVGYFPNSEQHAGWKIYDAMPEWFYLIAQPKSGDVALEVGCGYGEWMIPLAPRVRSVDGVDIHEAPLAKARELFDQYRRLNCRVQRSDGLTLPFLDGSFSLVYSISVFQHLPRSIVQGYLEETARVLAAGGRAVHHFRNADNVGPYPPLSTDIAANHTGDFSVGWTAAEVLAAAARAGLEDAAVTDVGLFLVLLARRPR